MSNYIPPTPTKKRDGSFHYYFHIISIIILLPLWIPIIIIDAIFNLTGLGRDIIKSLFRIK